MGGFFDINSFSFSVTLFIVGTLTGFIGAMGGSGGLILVPFMIASGMHPALALGTARLAATAGWVIAFRQFNKAGQIRWKELPFITIISVIAGAIGTLLIIDIDEKYVYPVVGVILLLVAPLSLMKKDFGLIARDTGEKSALAGYALYFLAMVYGGFFGAGSSIIAIFVLVTFFGFRVLEAHATDIAAWIVMSVISSAIFIYYGQVDYALAFLILISMAIGSYIGSRVAIKGGDIWVKRIVFLFALIMGVKLLLWP